MSTDNPVGYVAQSTNNTCWAASTAMLLGRSDDMSVVQDMKEQFPDSVWDDGATQLELGQVAQAYGFTQIYPVCQGPDGWDQWLNDNGALLIQVPGNAYHSIVVAGITVSADESVEPSYVHVMDPWHGDRWLQFEDFNSQYEMAGTNWGNNVYRR